MDKYSRNLLKIFIFMLAFFIGMVLYCAKDVENASTRIVLRDSNFDSRDTVYTKEEKKEEKANNKVSSSNKNIKENKKSNNNKVNSNSNTTSNSNKTSNSNITSNNNEVVVNNIDRVPIFTFHRIVPKQIKDKFYKDNEWVSSLEDFEKMMKYLYDNNYKTIDTLEFYDWYKGKIDYKEKVVIITFDDGYLEDYTLAYPILKKYNLKATSFIICSKINPITPMYDGSMESYSKDPQIFMGQDILDNIKIEYPNIELQSHSYNLHSKVNTESGKIAKVFTQTEEQLDSDVKETLKYGFKTIAYPFGAYNKVLQIKLEENGYLIGFSFGKDSYGYATRKSEQYAMNRIKIDGNTKFETFVAWLNY